MNPNLFEESEPGYDVWREERHIEKYWQRPTIDLENETTFPPETESVVPQAKVMSLRLQSLLFPCVPALVLLVVGFVVFKKLVKKHKK